jgi:hypothetical protein
MRKTTSAAASGKRPKIAFGGRITAVQPRIRLTRSYDQRSHTYQGYVLRIDGSVGEEKQEFLVAIGESQHARKSFRVGDLVSGEGERVPEPEMETAELYRVAKLKLLEQPGPDKTDGPPWHGVAPGPSVYRLRGHRRLDAHTYEAKCTTCIWGCRMPVEMIIDQWKPDRRRYRFETFCYGPLACSLYKAGPTRKVQGRKSGMVWEEADWIDEDNVAHRGPND